MATIECEITEKSDKNANSENKSEVTNLRLSSEIKTEQTSNNSESKNGNVVINVNSDSCQDDKDSENGAKELDEFPNSSEMEKFRNGPEKKNGKTGNGKPKISSDLLAIPLQKPRKSFMEEENAKEKVRLTLLKQCSAILKQGDQWYTKESLHKTFQDQDLLERIFRLFDTENQECLVQADWLEFLKQRLIEEKQLNFVEQVESVAYVLCGNDDITLDTFQHILSNKVVIKVLFRVLDTDGDGYVTVDQIMEFISAITSNRPRVGFDKSSVDRLEQLFKKTVGDQKEITKEQFEKIMQSKNHYFTERVFQIFDEDHSGAISLQEFIAAVHRFAGQTEDKIRFLFKVYDMDNDGLIEHHELRHVIKVCMEENNMEFSESELNVLTSAMFEDADTQRRGAITYEAFRRMLDNYGGLLENITISIDRWLVPPKVDKPISTTSIWQQILDLKPYQLSKTYFRNNYVFLGYLTVFFGINLILFVTRCIEYREHNVFTILARGCGQCLNFDCSWILVLMLRHCITQLRARGFCSLLPLDHHIYLHKLTGVMVFLFGLVHTVMHLCNFSVIVVNHPVINRDNYTLYEWLLTSKPGQYGLIGGWANPTGFGLLAVLAILFVCSQPFVRRGGRFKIFYWTHLLYIPFWGLLILHGPNFLKWFIVPGAIYVTERILKIVWMMSERSKTYISSGVLLPSRVTHLIIKRPPHFEFHAGDYVFVNIPAIAFYEWHPFTISSAPEHEGYISLHIRGVGVWTNRLYKLFEHERVRLHGPTAPLKQLENQHEKVERTSSNRSRKSNKSKPLSFGSFRKPKKVSVDLTPQKYAGNGDETYDDFENINMSQSRSPEIQSPTRLLEKTWTMPLQKKGFKNITRDFLRSESEHTFSTNTPGFQQEIYNNQFHKDLERRYRYMRVKPSIIAFKTPSFDECQRRRSNESIITQARRRLSKSISPDKDPEVAEESNSVHTSDIKNVAERFNPDNMLPKMPVGKPLEIYIDGPYGAASSHIFQAEHAALIAAGIGVTPFASILQAIMYRYSQARSTCPKCEHSWTARLPSYNMRLRKVDFFWINRDQHSFEWFVSLLSQLEIEQAELEGDKDRFLEMHMYITSALQKTDMKAVVLQMALDMLHKKEKRDLITGLKTRTNAGRPNWDKVFQQLQDQNKGKVTVFYCGPPQLARTLKIKCTQYGFLFRKEVF